MWGGVMIQHPGLVLWFTGLSGSGKSTVARALEQELKARRLRVELLDSQIVRQTLTRDLGYSKDDRDINIERVTFVAKLLSRNNIIVVASFISPYEATRQYVRREVTNYIEIFTDSPLKICMERDRKGLYEQAIAGKVTNFTGVNDPYEVPKHPDIHLHTERESVAESVEKISAWLESHGLIPGDG
jgi:adenylyl-sulfate kinase